MATDGAKKSERPWLEAIAACLPDGLAFLGADHRIIWSNREFAVQLGENGGLKGESVTRWIPHWATIDQRLSPLPGRHAIPLSITRPDGSVRRFTVYAIMPEGPLEARWILHLRDQTELRELQQQLQARERSYSFLREHTSDLIVRADAQLLVTWTNDLPDCPFAIGDQLTRLLSQTSLEQLGELSIHQPSREVSLLPQDSALKPFALKGTVRRLTDEAGESIGFSFILRDDSEDQSLARFISNFALTAREEEIIRLVVQGYSNLNIATILGLSESGVKFHIRNVFSRAKLATRTELMALLMRG